MTPCLPCRESLVSIVLRFSLPKTTFSFSLVAFSLPKLPVLVKPPFSCLANFLPCLPAEPSGLLSALLLVASSPSLASFPCLSSPAWRHHLVKRGVGGVGGPWIGLGKSRVGLTFSRCYYYTLWEFVTVMKIFILHSVILLYLQTSLGTLWHSCWGSSRGTNRVTWRILPSSKQCKAKGVKMVKNGIYEMSASILASTRSEETPQEGGWVATRL